MPTSPGDQSDPTRNPTTTRNGCEPKPWLLPLQHLPVIIQTYGVHEAHVRPYVGRRLDDDSIRCWRTSPALAWGYPLVEWTRTGGSYTALAFDIDTRLSLEHLAAASMGSNTIPTPNLTVFRKKSGHAQAIYTLRRPVLRGPKARPWPLAALGRASEWLLSALAADKGFAGVLVSNPTHSDYDVRWLRTRGYSLDEFLAFIPHGWRRPTIPKTDVGRNDELFRGLLRYAGHAKHSDADVAQHAQQLYRQIDVERPHAFTVAELGEVVASVLRRRAEWRDRDGGWHDPDWIARQRLRGARNSSDQQAAKGRRSGEVRRERTQDRDRRILNLLDAGWGVRQIGRAENLPRSTVSDIRTRRVSGEQPHR